MTTVDTVRDPASLTSPFVGLTSYAQENAPFFFGRDAEQRVLISNLRASRLTLLYAQSGAGKSSVLRAGAAAKLAELARRSVEQRGFARYIPVVFSSWRDEPTGELMAEIEKAIAPFLPEPPPPGRTLERLDEVIEAASNAAGATLLVVLDQFEEYFLYRPREAHDGRFADELAACINRAGLHANFLISIREDAYSGLGDLFQGRIRNVYSNYLHLEHLTRESAREAIEKPITSFNELHPTEVPVEIESGLADLILGQLGPDQFAPDQGGKGRLPGRNGSDLRGGEIAASYLQLVMQRLWETELTRGSRTLHRATLEELGGAQTIVRTHVDRALDDLPEEAREAAVDIFHHLVTPSGTKIALAASDLAEYTGRPAGESSTLLERLASSDTRILRPVPPPPGQEGGTRYEISHDLLAPAILDWGGRQRAVRLEREKESAERVARVEKRRARMFRTLALGSGALLIIAIVALVVAAIAAHTAQRASQNADRQHAIALSRQLAAESLTIAPANPVTARRLAVAAWRVFPTNQASSAMTTLLTEQQQNGILPADPSIVNGVAFSPDGKLLASAGASGTVRLWDPVTSQAVRTIHADTTSPNSAVNGVAFSPDGKLLASAGGDGTVRLWDPVTGRAIRTIQANTTARNGGVFGVAFSRDGKLLASAGGDGTVGLWDPVTGRAVRAIQADTTVGNFGVFGVAFSPDGKLLASAGSGAGGGTVGLWDPVTGRAVRVIQAATGPKGGVFGVAFSPDGKLLASVGSSASGEGTVGLWDPVTGRAVHTIQARITGGSGVSGVAFSSDGKLLASAGGDGTVGLWDPVTGRAVRTIQADTTGDNGGVFGVAFSPDGKLLASASGDGTARLWDPVTGRAVRVIQAATGGNGGVFGVAFSPGGKLLVSGGAGGTVGWWDPVTGRAVRTIQAGATSHNSDVNGVTFSLDGKLLASAGGDGTVRLWDPVTGRAVRTIQAGATGGNTGVFRVAFSPDGKLLASAGGDGTVGLWDPVTGRAVRTIHAGITNIAGVNFGVTGVAFSPDGKLLASAGGDGTVGLWDPVTGRAVRTIQAGTTAANGSVFSVAFRPDGKLLASAGGDGTVRLWDPVTGRAVRTIQTTGPNGAVFGVAFSPGGKLLASASASASGEGTVGLWDPVTGRAVRTIQAPSPKGGVFGVTFSPDGKMLASADADGTVRLWSLALFTHPYEALCTDVGPPTRQDWKQYASGEPRPRVCA